MMAAKASVACSEAFFRRLAGGHLNLNNTGRLYKFLTIGTFKYLQVENPYMVALIYRCFGGRTLHTRFGSCQAKVCLQVLEPVAHRVGQSPEWAPCSRRGCRPQLTGRS